MSSSRTALFVIDIQKGLAANPKTEIPHAARIKDVGDKILLAARSLNASPEKPAPLIVFVQHEETPDDGDLVNGSESWKLVFTPQAGADNEILVSKTTRDTFVSQPQLAERLKAEGIGSIVVFGIQSECCVQETCKGAIEAGFKVTLLQGAHSTYDTGEGSSLEIEKSVEDMLRSQGARIVPWEDVLRSWKENGTVQ
ncbi:hypothetical protein AK830_g4426 [Neonectria ditissima]|uniref:Isochorismatase-like domain-containing protein n=1 Tax=Neonectria ditissima TaxID=78410 RepID=A0A0P7BP00_9HYPO|nr:hypothetical protein AK830_g4426 [Neonectria ditissima]